MVPAEKRCAGARESGEEFVGGARGMRATILEKAVAVRLATALGHFKTNKPGGQIAALRRGFIAR